MVASSVWTDRRFRGLAVAVCAAVVAGCGTRAEPWGTVTGRVLFEDAPAGQVVVLFSCPEQGVEMTTVTDADGTFRMTTAKVAGLPTGHYRVAVSPARYQTPPDSMTYDKAPANPGPPRSGPPDIPPHYREPQTSGLTATVSEGPNHVELRLKAGPSK